MLRGVLPLAASVLVLAAGSSRVEAAANKEHLQLVADLRMLQEQAQQLQILLGSVTEALKAVTARLDEQAGATRKAFADQRLLVDNVSSDLRVVREKVDETNVRITSVSQELEALRLAIPRTPVLTAPDALPPDPGSTGTAAPPATPPATFSPGISPEQVYQQAIADYFAGQWDIAERGLEAYIRSYPKSDLADDAQYYIGEAYFADGKFQQAVESFDRVISTYPRSDKLPNTYYKRGLALERLGQIERARQSHEFAVKNFPDSDAGRLAKQALERLNKARP